MLLRIWTFWIKSKKHNAQITCTNERWVGRRRSMCQVDLIVMFWRDI